MIDKIKSNLTNSYLMFIFDFADSSQVNKDELLKRIECPLLEIFKTQKNADKTKKVLGKNGFGKALFVYFNEFQSQDGIDFNRLEKEIAQNRKVFLRHLGKDKVNYLTLLISIDNSLEKPKKGLLGVAV